MKKFLIVLLIILIAALAGGGYYYYTGYQKYSGVFLPNTTINGISLDGLTPEEAVERLKAPYYEGDITLHARNDVTETIPVSDVIAGVELEKDPAAYLNEDDVKLWPLKIRETRTFDDTVNVTYDDEKLKESIKALDIITGKDIESPQNAYFAKTDKGFEIVPETKGNLLDRDKVFDAVKASLEKGSFENDLDAEGCYFEAVVKSDDKYFDPILEELDKYKNLVLTMDMVEATETLDYSILEPMLDYKMNKFVLDKEKLRAYVDELEKKYHTYQTERMFKTHGGETIAVGGGGGDTYGFWMDVNNMTDRLYNAISTLESQDVAPSWKTNAMTRGQENGDIGGTYVEVSISQQKLWFYRGYEQVFETDVVTGMESEPKRQTPRGVFCILNKKRDHTMTGSYGNQFCHYYCVFDWTGCALHDAYWRSSFGGDIYQYSGSHGCVNIPPDAMAELFEMIYTGLPVIIY